jgi:cytochrome c
LQSAREARTLVAMRSPLVLRPARATGAILLAAWLAVPGAAAAQDAGDPERGREVFLQACQPCHDAAPGSHQVGPSLHGVIGRQIGTAEGYRRYSSALKSAAGTWTPARLDRYLSNPQAMFPEQRKRYDGLANAQDRVDLIAYLRQVGNQ